jgi:hypothetical protein
MKEGCGEEPVDIKKIYTVGCLELFEKQFTGNMGIVGGKRYTLYLTGRRGTSVKWKPWFVDKSRVPSTFF